MKVVALFAVLLLACSTKPPAPSPTPPPASSPVFAPIASAPPPAPVDYTVLVTDPPALRQIEARGASFGELVDAARYASIVKTIEGDVAAAKAADSSSGVGLAFSHRLFDVKKLTSPEAKWELIGVANRLDRAFVAPTACGEVRFVYRLRYRTTKSDVVIESRLPATIAVSYFQREKDAAGDCRDVAARWAKPFENEHGPLKSIEVNLQIVRWPSTVRPDLGGHAEYLMRAFVPGDHGLVAEPLENTPDVARVKRDPALRSELAEWIRANGAAVDRGTAVLPDKFLATRATSVSPRGLARRANRPFRQLFEPSEIGAMRLRHLDELSCQGCHQSRSIAGFHLIGEETAAAESANAVAVGESPHLSVELARRKRRTRAVAEGRDEFGEAPLAERGVDEAGHYGAHCGLEGWTCAAGLHCTIEDDPEVGICLPETPAIGDPCESGLIDQDRVTKKVTRSCGAGACETNQVGFPGGMCEGSCGTTAPGAICTGIPILTGFNACLAKKTPFEQCILENTTPGAVRACDATSFCRDDYVCARTKNGGACMPPYFLFQLRVDGHP